MPKLHDSLGNSNFNDMDFNFLIHQLDLIKQKLLHTGIKHFVHCLIQYSKWNSFFPYTNFKVLILKEYQYNSLHKSLVFVFNSEVVDLLAIVANTSLTNTKQGPHSGFCSNHPLPPLCPKLLKQLLPSLAAAKSTNPPGFSLF